MSPDIHETPDVGRNLVVCIDGTSNQFGKRNTNVVDLYHKIVKSDNQLTYYNSGIGTFVKPKKKPIRFLLKKLNNDLDLAFARNFERNITKAYRWLSDNYGPNDKIYLFGFSRGAYQVRVLAGMIHKVGLIYKGNEEQIPFAYDLYCARDNGSAQRFKDTFSRKHVHIHFVGVWDTVSSVGLIRAKLLPLTTTADHVCHFRHALALDECRVKFLPEYANKSGRESGGRGDGIFCNEDPDIKEVWFPGTHSDIGGGNRETVDADLLVGGMPLLWMSFEAFSRGLVLRPPRTIQWPWDKKASEPVVTESLSLVWKPFEWFPWKRPAYTDTKPDSTTRSLHRGHGRKMKLSTQRVHSSITIYPKSYRPKAILDQPNPSIRYQWDDMLTTKEEFEKKWDAILEEDIIDFSLDSHVFEIIESQSSSDQRIWLYSLAIAMQTEQKREAFLEMSHALETLIRVIQKQLVEQSIDLIIEFVVIILEHLDKSRKLEGTRKGTCLSHKGSKLLLEVLREKTATIDKRIVAVQLFGYTLVTDVSIGNLINDRMFDVLTTITGQLQPLTESVDEVLNLFPNLLKSSTISYENLRALWKIIRKRLTAASEDSATKEVARKILKAVLDNDQNRNRIFDNDVISTLFGSAIASNQSGENNLVVLGIEHGYIPTEVVKEVVFNELSNRLQDNVRHWSTSLQVLSLAKAIIPSLDLSDDSQCDKIRYILRVTLKDSDTDVKQQAVDLCTYTIGYDGILNKTHFDSMRDLASIDQGLRIGKAVMNFYQVATAYQNDVFNKSTIRAIWKKLYRVISKPGGSEVEQAMLQFFKAAAAARDELVREIFNEEDIVAFRGWMTDASAHHTREGAIRFLSELVPQDTLVVPKIVFALLDLLGDSESTIRARAVDFFKAALTQKHLRDTLFDSKIIAVLVKQLNDSDNSLRMKAIDFFKVALTQEDLQDSVFNPDTISELKNRLVDNDDDVKRKAIDFFEAVLNQEGVLNRFLDSDTISELGNRLGDSDSDVRKRAIGFFEAALTHEAPRDRLFNPDTISALGDRLCDSESSVKTRAVDFFGAALDQDTLRTTPFTLDSVNALRNLLSDNESSTQTRAVDFYNAALTQVRLRDRLFDGSTIAALADRLDEDDDNVKGTTIDFYKAALTQEGLLEKLLDFRSFAGLLSCLNNSNSNLKVKVVDFFTTALNQKSLRDWLSNSNIQSFLKLLDDNNDHVKKGAMNFFRAALTQETLRNTLFNAGIMSRLRNWLDASDAHKARAIDYFVLALTQKILRDKIFIPENIVAFEKLLNDSDSDLKAKTIDLFTAALNHKDIHAALFTSINISVLSDLLSNSDSNIKRRAVGFFEATLSHDGLRIRSFNQKTVPALANLLSDGDDDVRKGAIDFFRAVLAHSDLQDTLFPGDVPSNAPSNVLSSLRDRLDDSDSSVKITTINFFKAALTHKDMRDRLFDPPTISKLWNQLKGNRIVRTDIIEFFGAAVTQADAFQKRCFDPNIVSTVVGVSLCQEIGLPLIRIFSSSKYLPDLLYHCLTISTLCEPLESDDEVVSTEAHSYLSELLEFDRIRERISCPKLDYCMRLSAVKKKQPRHVRSAFLATPLLK